MSLLTANLGFVTFNSLFAFILLNRTARHVYVVLFVFALLSHLEFDISSTSFRVDTFFVHSCVRLVSQNPHNTLLQYTNDMHDVLHSNDF